MSWEQFVFGISIILFISAVLTLIFRICKRIRDKKTAIMSEGIFVMLFMGITGIISHAVFLSVF